MQNDRRNQKAWYLVYTKPRQERFASLNLERQGYETYLPLVRARRRRQGRYIDQIEAMFPRYLMVRLDRVTDNWGPVRSTYGVSNLVWFGAQPAKVKDDLVADFKKLADEQGVQKMPMTDFDAGDRVRMIDGVLAGYEAIFKVRTAKERVAVLFEIAGRQTEIEVPNNQIEAVN